MIRTQIYIPDDLYNEAKMYAKMNNTTISHFVRDGLRLSVDTIRSVKPKRSPLKNLVGKFSYGKNETDAASSHNDIYDL